MGHSSQSSKTHLPFEEQARVFIKEESENRTETRGRDVGNPSFLEVERRGMGGGETEGVLLLKISSSPFAEFVVLPRTPVGLHRCARHSLLPKQLSFKL